MSDFDLGLSFLFAQSELSLVAIFWFTLLFVTGRRISSRNLPYLFGYSIFMAYIMRGVRLWAYVDEWFLSGSRWDSFVPLKVRALRIW